MIETYYYIPNQETVSLKVRIDEYHPHIVPIDGIVCIQLCPHELHVKTNSLYMANSIFTLLPNNKLLQFIPYTSRQEMCICTSIHLIKKNQEIVCYVDSYANLEKLLQYIGCKKFFSWYPKSTFK